MPKSAWTHSSVFGDVHIAHEWGMLPSEYWEASADDRAYMMQYVIDMGKMAAWDHKVASAK